MLRIVGWMIVLTFAASIALLVIGVYYPEWLEGQSVYKSFAATDVGSGWIQHIWPWIVANGRGLLQVGVNVAIFGFGLYIWWRNIRVRRLCATLLYDLSFQILYSISQIESKKNSEMVANEKGHIVSHKLIISADTRGWVHRLNTQLEVLRDFSIAYDHALRQRARMSAAFARMYALSAKELVEQLAAEVDLVKDGGKVELNGERYTTFVPFDPPRSALNESVGKKRGRSAPDHTLEHQREHLHNLLLKVVDVNLELAKILDGVNWFGGLFLSPGRNAPKGLQSIIKAILEWHDKRKRSGDAPTMPFATFTKVSGADIDIQLSKLTSHRFDQIFETR